MTTTNGRPRPAPETHRARYFDPAADAKPKAPAGAPPAPVLVRASTVRPRPVEWLMPGWLPLGKLVVIDGDPGLGKSTLSVDLAARVSRGWPMPPSMERARARPPAAALLLSDEDGDEDTIRPRLDRAGADAGRVYLFNDVSAGGELRPVMLPHDLELAADQLRDLGVALVVVDPFMSYLGAEFDAHKDQDVRRCMRPLARLAARLRICIVLIRHLNKETGGQALYRGAGSIGISGASRSALLVGRDPDDARRLVLAAVKPNLGPMPASLAFRLCGEAGGVASLAWEGECDLTADDVLWRPKPAHRPPAERREATAWLAAELAAGPRPAKQLLAAAEAAGITEITLRRAKAALRVESKKAGRAYVWSLPQIG